MADIAFEKDLSVAETGIEGLRVVDLAVTATRAAGSRRTGSAPR